MGQNKKMFRFVVFVIALMAFAVNISSANEQNVISVKAVTAMKAPSLTIVSRTTTSVNLKYTTVSGATGYQIYRANTKDGSYKKIKTTKALTFKDTDTINGKVYYYKVRAYKKGTDSNTYGSFSAKKQVNGVLGKVSNLKASSSTQGIQLSWSSVSKATSYRIYRSTSKQGSYDYVTATKNKTYLDTNVTTGKNYYYKVRAYTVISSTKYYGSYSNSVYSKKQSSATSGGTSESQNSYQQQVLDLINKERTANGLSKLTTNATLEKAAYKRAQEIVNTFAHTRPDGSSFSTVLGEYNITYRACGENIAWGQRTPEIVMNSWMNSEGHRSNILSSQFAKVGIGYYVVNNTPYWVQVFTN